MNKRFLGFGMAAGLALVVTSVFSAPALAAPGSGSAAVLLAGTADVTTVRYERRRRAQRRAYRHVPRSYDTVGSIGYDGYGYGYNLRTGQRFGSCMMDEGYGRVRPCDAGGGPN